MQPEKVVIEAGTALVGPELEVLSDALVVIEGEKIAAVGARGEVEVPEGAERVDASGLLLMPGFIDAHVHIGFYEPVELVRNGVTTARDLGWPPVTIFALAEESTSSSFDGPTILAAGPMLTAPGGYPTRATWAPPGTGLEVSGPRDAVDSVGAVAAAGASLIKVALNPPAGPVLDHDTLQAIVDAAHDKNLMVTGHIAGLEELDKALDAGVDELAHMLMSAERIPNVTLERMVEAGVAVVPTLSVRFGRDRKIAIDNLTRFHELKGRVVYGTDLGNEGPGPGIDALEIRAMAEAGFTAREIVSSATVDAAKWLGLDTKGVLGPGADADLVAVPIGALDDPHELSDVAMVWGLGRRFR